MVKTKGTVKVLIVSIVIVLMIHIILKNVLNEDFFRSILDEDNNDKEDLKDELLKYIDLKFGNNDNTLDDSHPKESNFYDADLIFNRPANRFDENTNLAHYFNNINPTTQYQLQDLAKQKFGEPLPHKKKYKNLEYDFMGNPLNYEMGSNGEMTLKKDMWRYPNEKIMNGGLLDGVKGFDEEWDNYTIV